VVTGVLGFVLLRQFQLINVAPVSYSLVVHEMLDAIIVLDASRRIAGVNRAALRLMGRPDKDILGLLCDTIPGWLRIPEHLSRLEGAAELSYRLDGEPLRDPDSTYDVRVSRFPHGREPGWLVIIRDISAQSRAEAERTARIAAEHSNLAKDAFLAKLGHELRTPLTPVLAIISAALDERSIPDGLRSSLDIVRRNVRLEARLIDDLLDQSLISLGKLRLRTELIDAHKLLRQSVEDCAEFLREADLFARLDLCATNSRITADPGRLQQVRDLALACQSADGLSKPTGVPWSRIARVRGEGPRSASSYRPRTSPKSRRSIDLKRKARQPTRPMETPCLAGPQQSCLSRTIRIPCEPCRCRYPCSATRSALRTACERRWPPPKMENLTRS
jgi:PAS domain S-box-containing protein